MTEHEASYRRILKTTSLIGGATFGTVLIGLARLKLFALFLGPAGFGLLGVFNVVLGTASTLAGMGLTTSGVRQLSAAADRPGAHAARRWSLWALTWMLAAGALAIVWFWREPISRLATGTTAHAEAVGWLGLATAITVLASTQTVVLQSLRDMRALAAIKLGGALLGTAAGVAAVAYLGSRGIVFAVLALPLASLFTAWPYLSKHPPPRHPTPGPAQVWSHWRNFILLGGVVVTTSTIHHVAVLGIRADLVRDAGLDGAGLYQAVFTLAATNVSLVLAAMTADYLPRLAVIGDDAQATGLQVNQQARVALLIGGPLLVGLVAFAPLALHVLYSAAFTPAAGLLRWQVAGDLIKLVSWALSYVLVARGDVARYMLGEIGTAALFYGLAVSLPYESLGLEAYGIAYLLAQLGFAAYQLAVARALGLRLSGGNLRLLALLLVLMGALITLATASTLAAMIAGGAAAVGLGLYAYHRLLSEAGVAGAPAIVAAVRRRLG